MFGWLQDLLRSIVDAITGGFASAAKAISDSIWNAMMRWLYNSVYSAIADFFTMMGEYGRGDIRSCLDKGNRAIVYAVRLGFVRGGGGCRYFRFSRRVPKRKSEYKEYAAQYFKRLFRVFADRARADRII